MFEIPDNDWKNLFSTYAILLNPIQTKLELDASLGLEIYPPRNQIFRAFELCSRSELKVVIIGQDPYHGEGEANGLCFSVNEGVKIPPSLRNLFQELYENDSKVQNPRSTDLSDWARQGVLLINSVLTVEKDKAGSHSSYGWQVITDGVIREISKKPDPVVFILLGNYAKTKSKLIGSHHHIIEAPHPSPLSVYRGFYGSKIFQKGKDLREMNGMKGIQW
jgi:uracil-DNA glycosylase